MKRPAWGRLALVTAVFILSTNAASALTGSSAGYSLNVADMTNSAENSSSAGYTGTDTLGDSFDGKSSSTSYTLCTGFVEESLGGCVTSVPPPPPPPPPGGGSGRPPGYIPPPDVTQETEEVPPETQETVETEETLETQPTEEQVPPAVEETQEAPAVQPISGLRPAGPGGTQEEGIDENADCRTEACYAKGSGSLHGAAFEREDPWCFILVNLANALLTIYFIWQMIILYLMPDDRKKKSYKRTRGSGRRKLIDKR